MAAKGAATRAHSSTVNQTAKTDCCRRRRRAGCRGIASLEPPKSDPVALPEMGSDENGLVVFGRRIPGHPSFVTHRAMCERAPTQRAGRDSAKSQFGGDLWCRHQRTGRGRVDRTTGRQPDTPEAYCRRRGRQPLPDPGGTIDGRTDQLRSCGVVPTADRRRHRRRRGHGRDRRRRIRHRGERRRGHRLLRMFSSGWLGETHHRRDGTGVQAGGDAPVVERTGPPGASGHTGSAGRPGSGRPGQRGRIPAQRLSGVPGVRGRRRDSRRS